MNYTVTIISFGSGASRYLGAFPTLGEAKAAGERERANDPKSLEVQINDPDGNIVPPERLAKRDD